MSKCDTCLQTISSNCIKYTGNPMLELGLQCDIPLNDAFYIFGQYLIQALNDRKIDLSGIDSACVELTNNEKTSITLLFNKLFQLYCDVTTTGVQIASLPIDRVLFVVSKLDEYVNGDFWGSMTPMSYSTLTETKNVAQLFQYILTQIDATYATKTSVTNLQTSVTTLQASLTSLTTTVNNLDFTVTADWCSGTGSKTLANAIIYMYTNIKALNSSISGSSCTSSFSLSKTGYTGFSSVKAAMEYLIDQASANTSNCVGFNVTTDMGIPGAGIDFGTGTFTIKGVSNPATISLIAVDTELSAAPVMIDLKSTTSSTFCTVTSALSVVSPGTISGTYDYTVSINLKSKQATLYFMSGVGCKKTMTFSNTSGSGSIS